MPFSEQNGSKTIAFEETHTYIAYAKEYPPRISMIDSTRNI